MIKAGIVERKGEVNTADVTYLHHIGSYLPNVTAVHFGTDAGLSLTVTDARTGERPSTHEQVGCK